MLIDRTNVVESTVPVTEECSEKTSDRDENNK
jgi:hypothetical protein